MSLKSKDIFNQRLYINHTNKMRKLRKIAKINISRYYTVIFYSNVKINKQTKIYNKSDLCLDTFTTKVICLKKIKIGILCLKIAFGCENDQNEFFKLKCNFDPLLFILLTFDTLFSKTICMVPLF